MNDQKPSRKLKFRAWDEDNEVMYYSDKEYEDCFFGFDKGVVVAWLRKIVPQTLDESAHEVGEPIKAMQSIGKLDENRKEIYEKDFCKNGDWVEDAHAYNYRTEEVMWDRDSAGWIGWNFNESGMTCEVIGNACENPDLLEETK